MRFGGHDIGAGAAADQARINRCASLEVREFCDFFHLTCRFQNCADAVGEIDARMHSLTFYMYVVNAHTFARRLQLAGQARAGFQHQDAVAAFRFCLSERPRS